jgi:flagellar basal-body rod modification protein FlgD
MKLLVAQLKYQDPMAPADSTAMMAQTAQFTMVEKLDAIATQSATQISSSQNSLAGSLIGDQVVMTGKDGTDVTGIVTGMQLTADGPLLKVGSNEINISQLKEVDATGTTPASTSATDTTTPATTPSTTTPATTTPSTTTPATTTTTPATTTAVTSPVTPIPPTDPTMPTASTTLPAATPTAATGTA